MAERSQVYRRVAQWQSASTHTEEVAAFESCPAYQHATQPGVLFLSHCVPNPPDKGEKIRSHHELLECAEQWPVHLVCFAHSEREVEQAAELKDICASVYVEHLSRPMALARGALGFLGGDSLTLSFYGSRRMRAHVQQLCSEQPPFACFAYSSAMAQYAPADVPMVLDFVDIDSEKWFQFGETRRPSWLYRTEGVRLRERERRQNRQAVKSFVTTENEAGVLAKFDIEIPARATENGVDFDYFDPHAVGTASTPQAHEIIFVGAMDYYPNIEAACWFAENVFPAWREREPAARFSIVGRNPSPRVLKLGDISGVEVTGAVDDVRPFFSRATIIAAPMRIARGIQNKVLEALAMGKHVLASPEVAQCFGKSLPRGVEICRNPDDYHQALARRVGVGATPDATIREAARARFTWKTNLTPMLEELRLLSPQGKQPAERA